MEGDLNWMRGPSAILPCPWSWPWYTQFTFPSVISIILGKVDPTLVWFVVLSKCLLNEWESSPSLLRSLPIIVCHRDRCIIRAGSFFFFLNIYILLKYSWLTMFQVHNKVIRLYIYTYNIFDIILHYRLLQDNDYSSLHNTVNLCHLLHIFLKLEI